MSSSRIAHAVQPGSIPLRHGHSVQNSSGRPRIYSLVQLVLVGLLHIGGTGARPHSLFAAFEEPAPLPPDDATLWIYLGTALALVLLGGIFAGLTIALMGQDELYLQVISTSGEGAEKKNATKVLQLLKKGKHWVLVTLLVGNVITNETLPIVLDRSIGGGYAAAISSTVLVIIFGEIVPQSICVRYGLPVGAWMASPVLVLMWLFAPITWPIAKLLDYLLGEDHGTTYKKAGLKTLVTLHGAMGGAPDERLNEDEISIISGVLDLKAKPVGSIMTPMNDVFTLPSDAVLDEEMMDEIEREGYSRIPIHAPKSKGDFVGMLLVKMLITYDPEDARRVNEFHLATLPETSPDTSCLDIINFFQEGKSHMVLVSDFPGQTYGALGVVTLEDVIEELIGEEIIDESDVFIDIHKAIRRMHPAPTQRIRPQKGEVVTNTEHNQAVADESAIADQSDDQSKPKSEHVDEPAPPSKRPSIASINGGKPQKTFLLRRKSSGSGAQVRSVQMGVPEIREQMRKLGPSNLASRPKSTRVNTVKIKPGFSAIPENGAVAVPAPTDAQKGIGEDLLQASQQAKDGVHAIQTGSWGKGTSPEDRADHTEGDNAKVLSDTQDGNVKNGADEDGRQRPERLVIGPTRSDSQSTLGSLHSQNGEGKSGRSKSIPGKRKTTTARSGSITENIIDAGGVKKLVLELTSSNDDTEEGQKDEQSQQTGKGKDGSRATSRRRGAADGEDEDGEVGEKGEEGVGSGSKKTRRKRGKKTSNGGADENTPLLPKE